MSRGPWKEAASRETLAKLNADKIEGDKVVLTIASCYLQRTDRDAWLVLVFQEFPEHALNLNKTQGAALQALVGKKCLPDTYNETTEEFEGWAGLPLPLYKRSNKYLDRATGEEIEAVKLYACSPAQYDLAVTKWPKVKGAATTPAARGSRGRASGK